MLETVIILSSRLLMLTRQWTKSLLHMIMKSKKSIAVGIGGMEAIVVQGNGIETGHGTTMGDISMDDGPVAVEGSEACQGELAIEDGSVGNRVYDAGGTQSHGAKRVSDAHGAQLVGHNASMVSEGITGLETQSGAAEDLTPRRPPSNKPAHWASMTPTQRRRWKRIEKNRKERDQNGEGGQ